MPRTQYFHNNFTKKFMWQVVTSSNQNSLLKLPFCLSITTSKHEIWVCKHEISQLQKIKQLKRNMVCKYKFVLINNEYNLYFNSFTKEYLLILSSLNLTQTRDLLDFGWKMDWTVFTTNL